jgi:hypothetical protein
VAATVAAQAATLRCVARRQSLCPDDAEDALQCALEIYVPRLGRVDPATELAWLKVVLIGPLVQAASRGARLRARDSPLAVPKGGLAYTG